MSDFETPAPDLKKIVAAWEAWEQGGESPGKILANLKTAGLPALLLDLVERSWTPGAPTA